MRRSRFLIASEFFLCVFVLVATAGCSRSADSGVSSGASASSTPATAAAGPSASIGRQIYLTGVGVDGRQILTEAPPKSQGALLLGGGGCAACHGANGRGGSVRAANASIDAPNITYGALVKGGYTDATLQAAILWCSDEEGQPLDEAMPCWQMSDTDAASTIDYLKTLQ